MEIVDKKVRMVSKKWEKNYSNFNDSWFSNEMLAGSINLLTRILDNLSDDFENDFCLLFISRLYDLISNDVIITWYTLDSNLMKCCMDSIVEWLDKIDIIYKELVCKSQEVLVRQGGLF